MCKITEKLRKRPPDIIDDNMIRGKFQQCLSQT